MWTVFGLSELLFVTGQYQVHWHSLSWPQPNQRSRKAELNCYCYISPAFPWPYNGTPSKLIVVPAEYRDDEKWFSRRNKLIENGNSIAWQTHRIGTNGALHQQQKTDNSKNFAHCNVNACRTQASTSGIQNCWNRNKWKISFIFFPYSLRQRWVCSAFCPSGIKWENIRIHFVFQLEIERKIRWYDSSNTTNESFSIWLICHTLSGL